MDNKIDINDLNQEKIDKIKWIVIENSYDFSSSFFINMLIGNRYVRLLNCNWYAEYWNRSIWARINDDEILVFDNMEEYWITSLKSEWTNIFNYMTLTKMFNDWNIKYNKWWIWEIIFKILLDHAQNNTIFAKDWINFDNFCKVLSSSAQWLSALDRS